MKKISVQTARELRYNVYMNKKLFVNAMKRDCGMTKAAATILYDKAAR